MQDNLQCNAHHHGVAGFTADLAELARSSGEKKTAGEDIAFCCVFDRNRVASDSPFDVFCFQAEHPLKKRLLF